ncbi:MAG: oligoendopeptidase F [Phascolarctobacterium sp.]|nr:oligoendopeptidase F [Phascolarctobacterium sp.]
MPTTIFAPKHGGSVPRNAVPQDYKWNTSDIYPDDTAWKAAIEQTKGLLTLLTGFKGTLHSSENILACFKLRDEILMHLEKFYAYAGLSCDADSSDQHFQALKGEAEGVFALIQDACSFIEPELLANGEDIVCEFARCTELADYRFSMLEMVRNASHTLSADKEEILAKSSLATDGGAAAFRALTNADMKFPAALDSKGTAHALSNGSYLLLVEAQDRELRKDAFLKLHQTYGDYRNTFAATMTANCRAARFNSTVRNYNNTLEASLDADKIPTSLYDGLIDTVHANLEPLHDYIALKKELLGLEELHYYDMYVALNNEEESFACSFDDAKQKVLDAVTPLGQDYAKNIRRAFDEHWIDVYENKGKRSGAYSWGVYGVHPYVLLNYQPRYSSISTIAHELGHSLHSYYSAENQAFINADYTIFCAEIASTTNEVLLLEHTMQSANTTQKIFLLNKFLEAVRTTVYRQTQFAEFEKFMHGQIDQGLSLQAQTLEDYWLDSNARYYGKALTLDHELAYEWSRIPHYYTPFYVYKYATGYSAATAFATAILNGETNAVEKYLGFLKSGGSDYSLNILQKAGVDLNTPKPVEVTLQKFAAGVKELRTLLGK